MIVILSDAFLVVYVAIGWVLRYNGAVQPTIYVHEYIIAVRYS